MAQEHEMLGAKGVTLHMQSLQACCQRFQTGKRHEPWQNLTLLSRPLRL